MYIESKYLYKHIYIYIYIYTYIYVKRTITVARVLATGESDNAGKEVVLKNCTPFTDCISERIY